MAASDNQIAELIQGTAAALDRAGQNPDMPEPLRRAFNQLSDTLEDSSPSLSKLANSIFVPPHLRLALEATNAIFSQYSEGRNKDPGVLHQEQTRVANAAASIANGEYRRYEISMQKFRDSAPELTEEQNKQYWDLFRNLTKLDEEYQQVVASNNALRADIANTEERRPLSPDEEMQVEQSYLRIRGQISEIEGRVGAIVERLDARQQVIMETAERLDENRQSYYTELGETYDLKNEILAELGYDMEDGFRFEIASATQDEFGVDMSIPGQMPSPLDDRDYLTVRLIGPDGNEISLADHPELVDQLRRQAMEEQSARERFDVTRRQFMTSESLAEKDIADLEAEEARLFTLQGQMDGLNDVLSNGAPNPEHAEKVGALAEGEAREAELAAQMGGAEQAVKEALLKARHAQAFEEFSRTEEFEALMSADNRTTSVEESFASFFEANPEAAAAYMSYLEENDPEQAEVIRAGCRREILAMQQQQEQAIESMGDPVTEARKVAAEQGIVVPPDASPDEVLAAVEQAHEQTQETVVAAVVEEVIAPATEAAQASDTPPTVGTASFAEITRSGLDAPDCKGLFACAVNNQPTDKPAGQQLTFDAPTNG